MGESVTHAQAGRQTVREEDEGEETPRIRRFYVDTHGAVERRPHHVFDGEKVVKVRRLIDVGAVRDDEIYLDSLPVDAYGDVIELLGKGVRMFMLRRVDTVARLRRELSIEKNHENDALVLSRVSPDEYRELTIEMIALKRLLFRYNFCQRELIRIRQINKINGRFFHEEELMFRRRKNKLAREIVRMAEAIIPEYKRVCEGLGLSRGCLYGRVALADLLVTVDFRRGLRKILSYLGRHPRSRRGADKKAMMALKNLSISVHGKCRVRAKKQVELLKTIRILVARPGGGEKTT